VSFAVSESTATLPAGYTFAAAGAVDLDAIAAIEEAEFPVPWRRDYFAQEIREPQRWNRALRRMDEWGGIETVGYFFSAYLLDEMHVNKIATSRELWGQGLARWMMARSFDFAHSRGIRLMTLEVRVGNVRAIRFYDAHGFDRVYTRKAYYQDGEDALVMHKTFPGE
jgi:[ribosomal protein S18]-alanine N-acetyltransferase